MFFWARRPPVRVNGLKDHEAELESYLATKLSEGPKKSTARCHGLVPWSLTLSATSKLKIPPGWALPQKSESLLDRVSTGSGSDLVSDRHVIFARDLDCDGWTRSLLLPVLTRSKCDSYF